MKIAITTLDSDPNAKVDAHFGRCRFFCIADTDDNSRKVVDNSAGTTATQGAGFKAAETVAKLGVEIVLTGQLGPKAERALKAAGIRAYAVPEGSVDEALALFSAGGLTQIA